MRDGKKFDSVICFGGEDWWYHNRGHYDMQMMREFSRNVPVLYVNSIGMRTPKVTEGKMFFKRVIRKLKSFSRGLKRINDTFSVFSPVTIPSLHNTRLGTWLLCLQVKIAARRVGCKNPLLWIACPPATPLADSLPHTAMVYQRTDRYECFSHVDAEQIRSFDRQAKQQADITVFCSTLLYEEEGSQCRNALFVDHGVDFDIFSKAESAPAPTDIEPIPFPRVGFVGGIDSHTFDLDLFCDVIKRLPAVSFVLVGGCSLPEGWCPYPNVYFLGRKQYTDVAAYMAACDVLIMPWNKGEWIRACNPVKLKEYLAVGKPVVTTWFYELKRYEDDVSIATDADSFAEAIKKAIAKKTDPLPLRARVKDHTWTAKARIVAEALCSGQK